MKRRAFLKSSLAGAAMIAVPGFVNANDNANLNLNANFDDNIDFDIG